VALGRWQQAQRAEVGEAIEMVSAAQSRVENVQDNKALVEQTFIYRYDTRLEEFVDKNALEIGNSVRGLLRLIDTSSLNVEIDPLNLRLREHLRRRQTLGNLRTVNGIAEMLPFRDRSFDIVVCSNTLDQCIDMKAALQEIYRVLRPGGVLLLSVNTFYLPGIILGLLRPIFYSFDRPHPHHVNDIALLRLLKDGSFNVDHHWREPYSVFEARECIGFLIGGRMYGRIPKNIGSLFLRRRSSHFRCSVTA
jgi:SAM-dependent methyltransferase